MRYSSDRRGPRGNRGRAGRRAAGLRHRLPGHKPRQRGQHALQPGHRRHGQGAPGARAGRARRRDGQGGGLILHPVPDAQPRQGAGRALSARPGGSPALSGRHEGGAGAAGEPAAHPGRGRGDRRRGRRRGLCHDRHRRALALQGRRDLLRHLSQGPHDSRRGAARLGTRRSGGQRAALRLPQGSGRAAAPVQDRHPSARERAQRGL